MGPSHHAHLKKCSISNFDYLATPLGPLTVDTIVRNELISTGMFELLRNDVDEEEHSIEMHLPLLAKAMEGASDYKIVPIMVDALNKSLLDLTSAALTQYAKQPGNVFIISRWVVK